MAVRAWPSSVSLPAIDRRLLVGALLATLSAALVLVLTRPPETTPVLVAGGSLPAGTPLGELPVTVREVEDAAGLVVGTTLGELDAWVLTVPLSEGEPLIPSILRPPQVIVAPNVIALSLEPQHAVLGNLGPGDLVDVYVTTSGGPEGGATERVASDVYVISAEIASETVARGDVDVLLAIDDELALTLASAGRSDGVDLVKVEP